MGFLTGFIVVCDSLGAGGSGRGKMETTVLEKQKKFKTWKNIIRKKINKRVQQATFSKLIEHQTFYSIETHLGLVFLDFAF